MVVRQTNLLGLSGSDGVSSGVLHLFNKVLMSLLGEPTTFLGIEVDVVTPDLDLSGIEVRTEIGGQVEIDTDLMVLKSNQGQVQTRVAVEEEDKGKVWRENGRGEGVGLRGR